MVRLQYRYAFLVQIALLLAAGAARADEAVPAAPTDSLPGPRIPARSVGARGPPAPPRQAGGLLVRRARPGERLVVSFRRPIVRLAGRRIGGHQHCRRRAIPERRCNMPALSAGKNHFGLAQAPP